MMDKPPKTTPCTCMHEYEPICCNGTYYEAPCWAECDGFDHPGIQCTPDWDKKPCNK